MNKARLSVKELKERQAEKRASFKRVVEPRVIKAAKAISLVGNCASAGYSYTPEQVQQITGALLKAVEGVAQRFAKTPDTKSTFVLKG